MGGKYNEKDASGKYKVDEGTNFSTGKKAQVDSAVCDERQVLLSGAGTGNFRIEDDQNEDFRKKREELYNEAIALANTRVPLRQIVQDLNNRLDEFYLLQKEKEAGLAKPKKITFENVQAKVQEARVAAELKKQKAKLAKQDEK